MTSAIGKSRGFTLIELCFAIGVIGLMAGLCWPSLQSLSRSMQTRAEARSFAEQLQAAREQAVLKGASEHIRIPIGADIHCSATEAWLLPDGTAHPLNVTFGFNRTDSISVQLDETGRVLLSPLQQ